MTIGPKFITGVMKIFKDTSHLSSQDGLSLRAQDGMHPNSPGYPSISGGPVIKVEPLDKSESMSSDSVSVSQNSLEDDDSNKIGTSLSPRSEFTQEKRRISQEPIFQEEKTVSHQFER